MRLEFLCCTRLQAFDFTVDGEPFNEEIEGILSDSVASVVVIFLTVAFFAIQSLSIILGARIFLVLIVHTDH